MQSLPTRVPVAAEFAGTDLIEAEVYFTVQPFLRCSHSRGAAMGHSDL